ncbi:MAG: hypothetical protein IJU16_05400 [Clostridia bacterium]|nr:hypothetical protein [Clostridia bacterium]
MEDTMQAMTEETTEDVVQSEQEDTENGAESRPVQEAEETTEAESTESAAAEDAEGVPEDGYGVYLPIFKGKVVPIAASDKDRVTTLIQKGMKWDSYVDTANSLNRLAAQLGYKSANEFLTASLEANEQRLLNEAIEKYGEVDGKAFYEMQKAKRDERCQTVADIEQHDAESDRISVAERLATDLVELQAEYEGKFGGIGDVPKSVIQASLEKGISLLDAYNRYYLRSLRTAKTAQKRSEDNQQASTGPLSSDSDDSADPLLAAWQSGLEV